MLSPTIRILNFDNSLLEQKNLLKKLTPKIADFTRFGLDSRIWLNQKLADTIYQSLDPTLKHCPTFLGSGDYHHLSGLLIQQFKEPLTVIVFDHHPDWDILPPRLACASWVTYILKRPNIKKVILIGISSEDISTRIINTGNLKAFEQDRLEIYPYHHRPTHVFFRKVPANHSNTIEGTPPFSIIHWRELIKDNITKALEEIICRITTEHVYISIDKDCLKSPYAKTNWEEGCLELSDLLLMLQIIKGRCEIVGFDVTGEFSIPVLMDVIKKTYMSLDRHKEYTAKNHTKEDITMTNEKTNLEIIRTLQAH
ncbi:MAG: arginase family protein [Candidatus Omnitrophica bacterium]|nr:arginase family protein [Candidatus Omnitrophota bacterium]